MTTDTEFDSEYALIVLGMGITLHEAASLQSIHKDTV